MRPRTLGFLLASLIGAALFIRLGLWQVSRLHERQARNAIMRGRLAAPTAPLDSLRGSPEELRYRRASVRGVASYNGETILAQRSHEGSPGVFFLTPVRTARGDSAIIVVRGWAYSPDGITVDRARWQEGDTIAVEGCLDELPGPTPAPYALKDRTDILRRLDGPAIAQHAGVPLRPMILWATGPAPANPTSGTPARFPLPELDDGPHRSYAIQWFSFAAIALVGAGLVVRNDRRTQYETAREPAVPVTRA